MKQTVEYGVRWIDTNVLSLTRYETAQQAIAYAGKEGVPVRLTTIEEPLQVATEARTADLEETTRRVWYAVAGGALTSRDIGRLAGVSNTTAMAHLRTLRTMGLVDFANTVDLRLTLKVLVEPPAVIRE